MNGAPRVGTYDIGIWGCAYEGSNPYLTPKRTKILSAIFIIFSIFLLSLIFCSIFTILSAIFRAVPEINLWGGWMAKKNFQWVEVLFITDFRRLGGERNYVSQWVMGLFSVLFIRNEKN